jgi:hypothetical protein
MLNVKYFPSDTIFPPFKLAIRLKFFRDLVMPSRDSSSGNIESRAQDDVGFSRHFPAKVNRHIPAYFPILNGRAILKHLFVSPKNIFFCLSPPILAA